jgi:anti-sigma B factor antagonist
MSMAAGATVEIHDASESQTVVRIGGELDVASRESVESLLMTAISPDRTEIVVDLTDLTFCDSSGLSLFIAACDKAGTEGSALSFRNVPPAVRRLFAVAGVDEKFGLSG